MNNQQKNLTRRYLLWCYKTTKEDLDWIDRKFTQLVADEGILKELRRSLKTMPRAEQAAYLKKIKEFEDYMAKKKKRGVSEKFLDGKQAQQQPRYVYLQNRLKAIEAVIKSFLGPRELKKIQALYEQEMTRRILEAREHT